MLWVSINSCFLKMAKIQQASQHCYQITFADSGVGKRYLWCKLFLKSSATLTPALQLRKFTIYSGSAHSIMEGGISSGEIHRLRDNPWTKKKELASPLHTPTIVKVS